jgi:hypothetical protein
MRIFRAISAEAELGVLALLTALALVSPSITGHTSQTVVSPYKATVVIHNDTGVVINYMLKWGTTGEWKSIIVNNDTFHWHTYKLDADGRAPAPYIRFHNAADGYAEYKLRFGKFGSGPGGEIDNSTHYEFAFDGGSRLDLYKK